MKKLLFIIFICFTILALNSQENTADFNNKLTGRITRKFFSWEIELKYNEREIDGNFHLISSHKGSRYDFSLTLNGPDINYQVIIKNKIFSSSEKNYKIEILNNSAGFNGEINTIYTKNVYRKDIFDLKLNNKDLTGNIDYSRIDYSKLIKLKYGSTDISGEENNDSIFIKNYSLRFDNREIIGKIKNNRLHNEFAFQSEKLNEEELFIFLFMKIYFMIDDFIKNDSKEKKEDEEDKFLPTFREDKEKIYKKE